MREWLWWSKIVSVKDRETERERLRQTACLIWWWVSEKGYQRDRERECYGSYRRCKQRHELLDVRLAQALKALFNRATLCSKCLYLATFRHFGICIYLVFCKILNLLWQLLGTANCRCYKWPIIQK